VWFLFDFSIQHKTKLSIKKFTELGRKELTNGKIVKIKHLINKIRFQEKGKVVYLCLQFTQNSINNELHIKLKLYFH